MWETNKERRATPRQRIILEFSVLLVATRRGADSEEQMLPLIGYTRDISESGIGLIVSAKSKSVLHSLGQSYRLQLVLTVPKGSVELEITPARYQHINEGGAASRYIIGAQITRINDTDREKFVGHLN